MNRLVKLKPALQYQSHRIGQNDRVYTIPTAHLVLYSVKPVSSLSVHHRSRRSLPRGAGFAEKCRARIVDEVGMLERQARRVEVGKLLILYPLRCTP